MFENPRRGRQARNFITNVPKILDLKSSSKQIFLENWHWVPLITSTLSLKNVLPFLNRYGIRLNGSGYPFKKNFHPFERFGLSVRRKKLSSVWTACAIRSKKNVCNLCSFVAIFTFILSIDYQQYQHMCYSILGVTKESNAVTNNESRSNKKTTNGIKIQDVKKINKS